MKKKVFIVAGGPSLVGFDFSCLKDVDTIVVNSSIFHVPNANHFITMDYTWFLKNNICFEGSEGIEQTTYDCSPAKKYFVVSSEIVGERCERTPNGVIDKKFGLEYDLRLVDQVIYASQYGGIGASFMDFHCGTDSGYSALQLAIILGYEQIYLLGMDFDVQPISPKIVQVPGSNIGSTPRQGPALPIQKISLDKQTHFFKTMDKSNTDVFVEKLWEYLRPYPKALREIEIKYLRQVFSCSKTSLLNDFIHFYPVEYALTIV
jgi:hypothetical protein